MKTSTIVAVTVGTLAVATVGYAIYFDQKRRNDPEFRRKLKKEKKRAQKQQKEEEKKKVVSIAQMIEQALESIKEDEFPTLPEEREKFCMEQLSTGEALLSRGPEAYGIAAICFYKALKVYQAPTELVMVYQKTIPPEVFTVVMGMLSKDVKQKQEKYYTVFPPREMNVKVDELVEGITAEGQKVVRRGLVALKDFAVGEIIYSETPIISSLEPSLGGNDFCHYCIKQIVDEESKARCDTCTKVIFCSETCKKNATVEFHATLCTKDSDEANPERSLYDYTKETNNKYPEMIAKFLVTMVFEESLNKNEEFNMFDHIERLRFLDVRPSAAEEKEIQLLKAALGAKIPGIEEFINEERYLTLKGKLLYNAYGLSTSLDANRSVEPSPEQCRSTHDGPVVGAGFYKVTSYVSHSCDPNAKLAFLDHNNNMSVVATKEIKAGEELHVGFIDQKNGTLSTEQRRQELFQRYRFKCMCPLCEATDKAAEKAAEEATKEAAEETAEEATKEVTNEPIIEVGKADEV
ncbi:MAG: MAS20 protein import receptor-domain-containing protein [Benniella sp.]|nr:MAG: MAS20 protein import receptor-domain-containing protein [Benniella sp.]